MNDILMQEGGLESINAVFIMEKRKEWKVGYPEKFEP